MDLTWSMKDDKDTIVSLGGEMARTLRTFTTNYRMGFGSYADKPLMPYIFPGHEDNPCQSEQTTCAPIYGFRHHMKLSDDVQEFISKVGYPFLSLSCRHAGLTLHSHSLLYNCTFDIVR